MTSLSRSTSGQRRRRAVRSRLLIAAVKGISSYELSTSSHCFRVSVIRSTAPVSYILEFALLTKGDNGGGKPVSCKVETLECEEVISSRSNRTSSKPMMKDAVCYLVGSWSNFVLLLKLLPDQEDDSISIH